VSEVDSTAATGTETTYSIGTGWRFAKHYSVDLNYDDLGSWDHVASGLGGPLDARLRTISLGLGGTLDFGRSGFFGQSRVGVHRWQAKLENFETSFKEKGTDAFYSVGVGYDFSDTAGLILSYERFIAGGDNVGDVDRLMLGFELR